VRALAATIVRDVSAGSAAARTRLDHAKGLDQGRERALLTELVYGTLRHLDTLDHLLEGLAPRGLDRVPPDVLASLRVAAYQLVFLDHVPAAVAVSEAVESVRAPHLRGFANGVLRSLGRLVVSRTTDDAPPAVPATRRLPGRERGWVLLREDVMPDPEREPASWLALATAHPEGLVRRWIARFGFERALGVCRAGNSPPPLALRANVLRTTREALLAELARAKIEARPGERPEAVLVSGAGDLTEHPFFREGRATVQDETAMGVAPLTGVKAGARVLDVCAAPGGKTTHLAELMGDRGLVVATDTDDGRLDRVRENAARLGLGSIWVVPLTKEEPEPPGSTGFDAVLLDAPCSNTGVLRRRVEVRARVDALEPGPLHALQASLLRRALARVAPGGVLVYSTCSIEAEENEAPVRALVAADPSLELRSERLTLPAVGGGDGGYAATIARRAL
jgi:16S rRNA (cytosine967-C5)-methyltransferase